MRDAATCPQHYFQCISHQLHICHGQYLYCVQGSAGLFHVARHRKSHNLEGRFRDDTRSLLCEHWLEGTLRWGWRRSVVAAGRERCENAEPGLRP